MDTDTLEEMTALTQVRQQLEQAREDLKRECAVLHAQLANKAARLDALNVLLAEETIPIPFLAEENGDNENMTSRAKEIMQEAKSLGVRPRDITRRLRLDGVQVKDTFASNFLWRMRNKTQEVVEVGGKYYWKGFEPQTNNKP